MNNKVKQITEALNKKLKELEKEFGVVINTTGGKYNQHEINPKIKILYSQTGQNAEDIEKENFEFYATLVGAEKDWYNKTIVIDQTVYTIKSIDPKKRKYPIIAIKQKNRQSYKFTVSSVRSLIKK